MWRDSQTRSLLTDATITNKTYDVVTRKLSTYEEAKRNFIEYKWGSDDIRKEQATSALKRIKSTAKMTMGDAEHKQFETMDFNKIMMKVLTNFAQEQIVFELDEVEQCYRLLLDNDSSFMKTPWAQKVLYGLTPEEAKMIITYFYSSVYREDGSLDQSAYGRLYSAIMQYTTTFDPMAIADVWVNKMHHGGQGGFTTQDKGTMKASIVRSAAGQFSANIDADYNDEYERTRASRSRKRAKKARDEYAGPAYDEGRELYDILNESGLVPESLLSVVSPSLLTSVGKAVIGARDLGEKVKDAIMEANPLAGLDSTEKPSKLKAAAKIFQKTKYTLKITNLVRPSTEYTLVSIRVMQADVYMYGTTLMVPDSSSHGQNEPSDFSDFKAAFLANEYLSKYATALEEKNYADEVKSILSAKNGTVWDESQDISAVNAFDDEAPSPASPSRSTGTVRLRAQVDANPDWKLSVTSTIPTILSDILASIRGQFGTRENTPSAPESLPVQAPPSPDTRLPLQADGGESQPAPSIRPVETLATAGRLETPAIPELVDTPPTPSMQIPDQAVPASEPATDDSTDSADSGQNESGPAKKRGVLRTIRSWFGNTFSFLSRFTGPTRERLSKILATLPGHKTISEYFSTRAGRRPKT